MIGIVLITHDGLGDSLLDCVRHVMGDIPPNVMTLSIGARDDPQAREDEGRALVKFLDRGDGVLLLVDLFGSTPGNIAQRLCEPGRVEGVSGVNLPMLLRVVGYSGKTLEEAARRAREGGRECIVLMNPDLENYNVATGCANN